MEKQHIILSVTNDLNTDQRMIRICTTLAQNGFDVTLVGRKRRNSSPLNKRDFKQHRLPCFFQKGALFYAEYNLRLFVFLLFKKVHIINAIDADTLLACTLTSILRKKKLVFDAHEYFTEVPELTGRKRIQKIWHQIQSICIPHASLCYTVGPELAKVFGTGFNKPFHVVYNMPVKKETRPKSEVSSPPVLLYQGDLNIGRGVELAIEAVQLLPIELWIVGDGPIKGALVQQVKQFKLEEKVKFLGKISPDELHQITQQAFAGINLLNEVSVSYQYSIANKFFDYVQARIPSICADFIEYRKLNQQYEVGVLVPYSVNELVKAVELLLNDAHYYQKLIDNCNKAAETWCWENQQKELLSLYKQLVNE